MSNWFQDAEDLAPNSWDSAWHDVKVVWIHFQRQKLHAPPKLFRSPRDSHIDPSAKKVAHLNFSPGNVLFIALFGSSAQQQFQKTKPELCTMILQYFPPKFFFDFWIWRFDQLRQTHCRYLNIYKSIPIGGRNPRIFTWIAANASYGPRSTLKTQDLRKFENPQRFQQFLRELSRNPQRQPEPYTSWKWLSNIREGWGLVFWPL